MSNVRIGVVGIGNMGTSHSRWIAEGMIPGLELSAICDIDPKRLDWAKDHLPENVAKFSVASEMFKSNLVDAVLIATPHYQHPSLAIEAFECGLHVMCEKPAGVYTKQVNEMNAAAEKSGKVFGIMYNQRTDHLYRKMKELVDSGEFGKIKRTNWLITNWYRSQSYYDSGGWRATWAGEGGGVLINQCPHNLDLWQWICGMPVRVRAFCHEGKWHDIEVEDDVTAYVEYENGATGVFITCTADAPGTNRFEILLEGGKLVCEDGKLHVYKLEVNEREFNRTNKEVFKAPPFEHSIAETDGQSPQHIGVLRKFVAAILHGEELVAEGVEGVKGLSISNAMHLSSWLGETVSLPINEDLFLFELEKRLSSSKIKTQQSIVVDTYGSYNV